MVKINGHYLRVETYGPTGGNPVILLHHGLGSIQAWQYQIPSFVDAGYRVIVYDRWGYGKSETRNRLSLPSFDDDLSDLLILFDVIGIKKASLIGHSDGGTIGLYFAAQNVDLVTSLITVAAHIYIEEKMRVGIRGIQSKFKNDQRFHKGLSHVHGEFAERVFYNWYNGWHRQDILDWDIRPELASINCPTLVIQGLEDEHATPDHARHIAEVIYGSDLWLVERCGHMLPQENSDIFNRKIINFLNRVYGSV